MLLLRREGGKKEEEEVEKRGRGRKKREEKDRGEKRERREKNKRNKKEKTLRFTSLEGPQDGKGSGGKGRALSMPHLSSFPVCDPWLLAARGRQHIKKIIFFFLIARFSLILR